MPPLKLYDFPLSGNCYKVRLLLGFLGLAYQAIPINPRTGETLTPEFLRLNPRGQIPLLVAGETLIWDSQAILVYLARTHAEGQWLPTEPLAEARVQQWLALAQNELLYGLARARMVVTVGRAFDLDQCQQEGRAGLAALEARLGEADWLVGAAPTIADIACYPYVAIAPEGEIALDPYPGVRAWLARFAALPGWRPMVEEA